MIDNQTRELKQKIGFEIPGVPDEAIQPVGVKVTSDRSGHSWRSARRTGWR